MEFLGVKNQAAYQAAFTERRKKLALLAPEEIVRRSLARYDPATGSFEVVSLGQIFRVTYPDGIVTWGQTGKDVALDWALVLLNYLASAQDKPTAGTWVSYRELPNGRVFFGNLERYTLKELSAWYGQRDKNALNAALSQSEFVRVAGSAELNLQINFTPRVPVLLQFWDGDEDMPASSQILFDRTAPEQMHIEDLAVVYGIVKRWIVRVYSSSKQ